MELDVGHSVLLPPGGGEVIGDSAGRRVEILSDARELHATWSRFGPHRDGADLHVHRRHTDLFYVLEGELTALLGPAGDPHVAPAGTLVRVPPLVVHGFRNGSDAELRYVNLHAPGEGFADYLRALRDGRRLVYDQEEPPADGGRSPDLAQIGGEEAVRERPGLRIAVLADVEEIAIAEVRCQPGVPPPPPDHPRLESFYVLEGELAFTVADRELRAVAGAWVQLPRGARCTLEVRGSGEARYLEIRT
jgi:quercetin dioxygenase-like cupin family protein